MGLTQRERQALKELERHLAVEAPELDAILSGQTEHGTRAPGGGRAALHVWCMLVMLTCAVLMIGIVLLTSAERSCTGVQSVSCQKPVTTQQG